MAYTIYILECSNQSYYTGYTTDLDRRYQEHVRGTDKCKYTRSFPPQRIAAAWQVEGEIGEVLKIERRIKALNKLEKQRLIEQYQEGETLSPADLLALIEGII